MGFSEIWTLYDSKIFDEKERAALERFLAVSVPVGKDSVDVTPWLIVDMSNVTGCVGFMYGGHRAVFDHYLESYWRAIFLSGFKVKIVKDGKHDALRGVTKLHRMLQNANSTDIDATTGAMNIYFDAEAIVDSVMQECMAVWQQKVDCGKCGRVPTVEILRAEEEADTSIRSFCRESVRRSPNVALLVLSNDASLILGLEGKIYLVYRNGPYGNMPCLAVSPSRLELRSHETTGPPMLFGAAIPLPAIGTALSRLCCDTLRNLQSHVAQHQTFIQFLCSQPITSTVLLMVSCLLGGEHRNVDYDDRDSKPFGADAPFAVVMFMSNFLFCYDHPMRNKENRKQCNLVCATLAVMAFFHEMIGSKGYPSVTSTASIRNDQCFNTFGIFLKEMKDAATSIINSSSRQNSFSPQKAATQPSIFRLLYPCNSESFFKVSVAASAIHVDRMLQVLKNRLLESADLPSSRDKVLYTGRWSSWLRNNFSTSAADYSFDFHSALEPLKSFVNQVQLVLESQKKPMATLLSAPLSGENKINSWVRATEALRAEDGSSHLVWQSSVAAVCPAGYTMFKEKNLYSLARSSHKLPNKGFLVGDGFPEGRGSQRGLLWTFVPPFQHLISTDITSNPVWNGNVLLDLTARSQYLIGLQTTQQPAEDILENICHSNVRGIVSHIEFFWSQSCSDWFQPPPQLTPSPSSSSSSSSCSTAATTLRMSALMCGAMLQSLIIVFRDHADLLDERILSRIVEACLLAPFFSRSVSAAVAVVREESSKSAATTNSEDKKSIGVAHVSAQLQAWQGRVVTAMNLSPPFLSSSYCIVEVVAKVCSLLSGIAGKDRGAVWQLNRWLDLFGILTVLELYEKQAGPVAAGPDRDTTLWGQVLRDVLGLGSHEIVSTTYLFVNGLSIQKSTSTNGLQILENNIMACKSQVLELLKIFA